jgi:hypothetical protein
MATVTSGLENNFDYMADDYDWIANIYSCGQIRACKTAQMGYARMQIAIFV